MKKRYLFLAISCLTAFLSMSCSSGESTLPDSELPEVPPTTEVKPMPIKLNCGVESVSRVTDSSYETNDKIGLFVVNYQNGQAGLLQNQGNHVSNMRFTYSGLWTPDTPIYWQDNTTPADFYAYYPFTTVLDVASYPFEVKANQSELTNYKASEFLYGKATKVMPTASAINIQTKHLFSCMMVKVAPGNGFTAESLKAANVQVKLNGHRHTGLINLKNGTVEASGTPGTTIPYKDGEVYKAIVVPQTVTATNFISVIVNDKEYKLEKNFTFISGKRHLFTVTVNKISNGINVGITPWEDDNVDHGGTAE